MVTPDLTEYRFTARRISYQNGKQNQPQGVRWQTECSDISAFWRIKHYRHTERQPIQTNGHLTFGWRENWGWISSEPTSVCFRAKNVTG